MSLAKLGYYGEYGGRFVPEMLMPALIEIDEAYQAVKKDPTFWEELDGYLKNYVGRPTPLFRCDNLVPGGPRIYLKREDLAHTGAHKINNTMGQVLLARRMGKRHIVAETGAGQHGVATATAAALFGMGCRVYMGAKDVERQMPNVQRMRLLGAEVIPVNQGTKTLKDAINEAFRDWVTNVETSHYIMGSVVGAHPYPEMVRDFQSVIGREALTQIQAAEGRTPDALVACVGGGSNAMGLFHPFRETNAAMYGVEAAGEGLDTEHHSATICVGGPGVLHGTYSMLLQDHDGQIKGAHSLAPGLDYPGVGPEHSHLAAIGRARYVSITDEEAMDALQKLTRSEGIIPALESSHAVAQALKLAARMTPEECMIVNLSGRGDKDLNIIMEYLEERK